MGKISNKISNGLNTAIAEASEKLNINVTEESSDVDVNELLNSGVTAQKKRHRRTKAEIEAEKEILSKTSESDNILKTDKPTHIIAEVDWDIDKDDDIKIPKIVEIPDDILVGDYDSETISDYLTNTTGYCHKGFTLSWPSHYSNHDEFCQWDIEKAHINGKEDPDFDFRAYYEKGTIVWLVRHSERFKTKELLKLTLRTIYPRLLIGVVDKSYCECIGIKEKDNIFFSNKDALDYFNTIKANTNDEYDENTGKKKRKRKSKTEDFDEDIEDTEDIDISEEDDE